MTKKAILYFTIALDFSSSSIKLTFAPDETEKRLTIQTTADNVLEGTEKFTAVLTSTSDRVTITEDTADISIVETEKGNIQNLNISSFSIFSVIFSSSSPVLHIVLVEFQPSSYTVVEGERVVRFIIVKRAQTSKDVIVQFTTQDGSATCECFLILFRLY